MENQFSLLFNKKSGHDSISGILHYRTHHQVHHVGASREAHKSKACSVTNHQHRTPSGFELIQNKVLVTCDNNKRALMQVNT